MCELKFASWTTEVTRVSVQMAEKKKLFVKPTTEKSNQPAVCEKDDHVDDSTSVPLSGGCDSIPRLMTDDFCLMPDG